MEPNEKPKFNWQRTLITSGIVLFAALAVGGTTWYVMDKSAKEIKTANDKSVAALQKQIDELKAAKTSDVTTTDTKTNNDTVGTTTDTTTKEFKHTSPSFSFTYPSTLTATSSTAADPAVWLSTDGTRANTTLQITFEPSKSIDPKLYFDSLVSAGNAVQPYTVNGYGQVGNYRAYQVDYNHLGRVSSVYYVYNNAYLYTISFPGGQQEQYMSILKTLLLS